MVGARTRFTSPIAREISLPPRNILGYSVTLTITATGYEWEFGDGSSARTTPGSALAVEHVYNSGGAKSVSLRALYTAVFTIAGSPTIYPLDGSADVPGIPTLLTAREAHSQLEAGP